MKDVYIKDPISMLIPIRPYFVLSELQEMTHFSYFFLPPLYLDVLTVHHIIYLCSSALECSVYFVHWHFFVHVSSLHPFPAPFFFCCLSSSNARLTHQLISAYLIPFSSASRLSSPLLMTVLCPFTLCPSQIIVFSVSSVFWRGLCSFHPPTFSLNLFTFSFLCLFRKHFLGVFHAKLSSPDSFLSLGETQFTRCT